ncbi:MAG: sporulation integral membrane protein YlbJ [Bacillota bacterium]|nr:sporulation integral membrane protein YlbJ [Bacillota bacterium]
MPKKILLTILILIIFFTMIINPKLIFDAALDGLSTWTTILIPALFPFFVMANLLMRLGVINFLAVFLDPIMRPVFNVSGAGGFVMAIGFTSGFPISSLLTAELRQEGKLTKGEAERLMSFTNNASPLFIFSAIAVGMFKFPELGIILAGGHYLSNIIIGITLSFFSRKNNTIIKVKGNIFKRAYLRLYETPLLPIGEILGDSVNKGIKSIVAIGGFVVVFAITVASLSQLGLISLITAFFAFILKFVGYDISLASALTTGLFEVTLGVKQASAIDASFHQQVAIASIILAWNGLSIHAQVANFISKSDISYIPFLLTRTAQSILAPVFTLVLLNRYETVFFNLNATKPLNSFVLSLTTAPGIALFSYTLIGFILIIALLLGASLLISLFKGIFSITRNFL